MRATTCLAAGGGAAGHGLGDASLRWEGGRGQRRSAGRGRAAGHRLRRLLGAPSALPRCHIACRDRGARRAARRRAQRAGGVSAWRPPRRTLEERAAAMVGCSLQQAGGKEGGAGGRRTHRGHGGAPTSSPPACDHAGAQGSGPGWGAPWAAATTPNRLWIDPQCAAGLPLPRCRALFSGTPNTFKLPGALEPTIAACAHRRSTLDTTPYLSPHPAAAAAACCASPSTPALPHQLTRHSHGAAARRRLPGRPDGGAAEAGGPPREAARLRPPRPLGEAQGTHDACGPHQRRLLRLLVGSCLQ